jgi:signal transduction histidine kinase/ActR/RegA family two-component response regulator
MDNIGCNRIVYELPEDSAVKAMADMGIFMFRYYPNERMIINSDATMAYLGCRQLYRNMPGSFADEIVAESYAEDYISMFMDINEGKKKSTATIRTKEMGRTLKISLSPIECDDAGRAEVVLGVIEDIDDSVNTIEKQYEDCRNMAYSKITDTQLYEHQKLLEHALDEAQRANKAKTTFLNNMSHDIRTPMNAILGFASLAERHIDNKERVNEYLGKILDSGNQLLTLINGVLDMTHIESGKIQIDEQKQNLIEFMDDLKASIQDSLDKNEICFDMDIKSIYNPNVYCDGLKLKRILMNILDNAIKFTDKGGRVKLTLEEIGTIIDGAASYEIHIIDTGIGMSKEFQKRIYVPFERERSSTESGVQGTGLGMSISKKLIDMMDGSIKIDSEEDKGTDIALRFRFKLAGEGEKITDVMFVDDRTEEYTGYRSANLVNEVKNKAADKKLLLVEDNELNQEITVEILKEAGFTVDVADDGTTAVEMMKSAEDDEYALILMDIQMPIMNGYEATMRIRRFKDEKKADIPIIAMTANAFDEDRQNAIHVGMNGYISKPISISRLMNMLNEVLD